ncbi:50S ribosomal protein L32e [Candidatus Woesearchaeota archaeon]|nr:50S ribosomal protein L32e [Candidatus Woesearchaeota archaeon]
MSESALKIRKKLRKKRPSFHREDSHKVKSVKRNWRKPVGSHSKVRHQLKGYVKRVEPGYRSPRIIRGTNKDGLFPVKVNNVSDLNKVDKTRQGVVIASNVGKKKAVVLLNKAKEMGLSVLNVKDIDLFIRKIDEFIKSRKEKKDAAKKKKESKVKEKKKSEEKKPKLDKKVEDEDKKKEEKRELDKTLSKRQR